MINLSQNASFQEIADVVQLANNFFTGENYEIDFDKAIELYVKAAQSGHIYSQYMCGFIYQEGYGIEKNFDLARHYYTKAAGNGHDLAYLNIGVMEQLGQGCEVNAINAAYYYEQAVNLGNGRACINLAQLYHAGALSGKPDYEMANKWYERALGLGQEHVRNYINQVECFINPKSWARKKVEAFENQPINLWDLLIGRR